MKTKSIINRIIDDEMIIDGSVVIVGISGGPDSLCLLHALSQIEDSFDLTLVPVHVNHKLRKEADREADNVVKICDKLGLECKVFEVDCKELAEEMKVSTEEAGRNIRYEIFDDVAASYEEMGIPADRICIALAHNADDQAETVLFRLLRGTGVHGLAGIPSIRTSDAGFLIVRPLIEVERADIEDYIKENRLHPNIDKSNMGTDYTRNKIRNELIPYLENNYNPNIRQTLRRFAANADMDDSLLSELAFNELTQNLTIDSETDTLTLDLTELRDNPPSILTRIINFILQTIRQEKNASYKLVVNVMKMIYSDNPSGYIDLPGGYRAYREYDSMVITRSERDLTIQPDSNLRLFPQVMMKKDYNPDDEYMYAAFDFDKFNEEYPGKVGELVLRTRREGDYLPMRKGRKKIQDLLVDSKVPKNARDSIQMVAIENEVLWILPSKFFSGKNEPEKGRFSQKYQISDETERVLYIEIAENI